MATEGKKNRNRKQRERSLRNRIMSWFSDKPVPGGPSSRAMQEVQEGVTGVRKQMEENKRQRQNRNR